MSLKVPQPKPVAPSTLGKADRVAKRTKVRTNIKGKRRPQPQPKNNHGRWRYTYVLPFYNTKDWVWEQEVRYRKVNVNKEYPNQRADSIFSVERALGVAKLSGKKAVFR